MFLEEGAVLSNVNIAENKYLMKVVSEKSCAFAKPGQFYMLRLRDAYFTLRRPVSIHYANPRTNVLEFYYEVKGSGTKDLSGFRSTEGIGIQGPLGKGFDTNQRGKELLLVGGGMGLAPMKFLAETLREHNRITLVAGGKDAGSLKILENFDLEGMELYITTDDGSLGYKGTVIPKVSQLLTEKKFDGIYVCGPGVMMNLVGRLAVMEGISCEVSLESRMACGVKACVGCSFLSNEGMKKVCADGPVFNAEIIREINNIEHGDCATCQINASFGSGTPDGARQGDCHSCDLIPEVK